MPELPEVELARRALDRWLSGRTIVRTAAAPNRVFRGGRRARFLRLSGPVESLTRRGKYLLWRFPDGEGLLAHLGMTGKFVLRSQNQTVPYSRARFFLDSGKVIHYCDPRLLGRLVADSAANLAEGPPWSALGRDPWTEGLNGRQLAAAVGKTRSPLKVALMDQKRLAGLGNLHAAEALFRAGLNPRRLPQTLSVAEWQRLARGIRGALVYGLKGSAEDEIMYMSDAGFSENPFFVYGRGGETCRRCPRKVSSLVQGGRTTYYCPGCQ